MEIDAINVFTKVVESGSFTAAAARLGMPKTTVSAKVAALEKRLGVTLIQRTTRRLHVTNEGRAYYQHCALALEELEKGESLLRSRKTTPSGELKITAPIDIGHTVLPPIVEEYLGRYPEASLQMLVTNRVVDLVGEGVDLAIRVGHLKDSTLMTRKFFDVDMVFCATPDYIHAKGMPRTPKELDAHEFILYPGFHGKLVSTRDRKKTENFLRSTRLAADEMGTLKSLALRSLGIACLPRFLVSAEFRKKVLVEVLPDWHIQSGTYYAFVYPGHPYQSPNVREFMSIASRIIVEMGHSK